MGRFRARSLLHVGVLALIGASLVGADEPADQTSAERRSTPKPVVTVSPQTTRIVAPLRKDGYVDYVAALNQRFSKGVTAENNAVVLLLQAMGPGDMIRDFPNEEHRKQFFQLLGMPPLPERGRYFVQLKDYARRLEKQRPKPEPELDWDDEGASRFSEDVDEAFDDPEPYPQTWQATLDQQYREAGKRPWSKDEFPELAKWLEVNRKPLRTVIEATQRPRFYTPFVDVGRLPALVNAPRPGLGLAQHAAHALVARAMLRLHEQRIDDAWEDVLALHRLARLTGQGPMTIDGLLAAGLETSAFAGDAAVAHHGNLTPEQANALRADLRRLGPVKSAADKFDQGERYMYLDAVITIARDGPDAVANATGPPEGRRPFLERLTKSTTDALCDWDQILRNGNTIFDRLALGARLPNRIDRLNALWKVEEEVLWEGEEETSPEDKPRGLLAQAASLLADSPRAAFTRRMERRLNALLMPIWRSAIFGEDRVALTRQMTDLAFALAAYRFERRRYPAKLSELVPAYLKEVPLDLFSGKELIYRRKGNGYLLYSIGANGEDDHGQSWDDGLHTDDVVIRTPGVNP